MNLENGIFIKNLVKNLSIVISYFSPVKSGLFHLQF